MSILLLILRRLRDLLIVLLLVGTGLFLILHTIPGSAASAILGPNATQEQIELLEAELGLNRPLVEQYGTWLFNLLRGDLGYSFSQNTSVLEAFLAHLGATMALAVATTVLGVVISIPLAILSVARPSSIISKALVRASAVGLAIPGFWLALILILGLALTVPLFPVSGYVSPIEDPLRAMWYLALPVLVLLCHQVSLLVMTLRESLSAELSSHYVRTARAKGASESRVYFRHILRNAMLPALTVIGNNFGTLLGGIIIIETIFLIPGVGWLINGGIQSRDYNLILGVTLCTAVLLVLVNLIVDILYGVLDPRVRGAR